MKSSDGEQEGRRKKEKRCKAIPPVDKITFDSVASPGSCGWRAPGPGLCVRDTPGLCQGHPGGCLGSPQMSQPIRSAGALGRAGSSWGALAAGAAMQSSGGASSPRASRAGLPLPGLCFMLGLPWWEVVALGIPGQSIFCSAGPRVSSATASAPAWMEPELCRGCRRRLGSSGLVENEREIPARGMETCPASLCESRGESSGWGAKPGILGEGRTCVASPSAPAWGMTRGWFFWG